MRDEQLACHNFDEDQTTKFVKVFCQTVISSITKFNHRISYDAGMLRNLNSYKLKNDFRLLSSFVIHRCIRIKYRDLDFIRPKEYKEQESTIWIVKDSKEKERKNLMRKIFTSINQNSKRISGIIRRNSATSVSNLDTRQIPSCETPQSMKF